MTPVRAPQTNSGWALVQGGGCSAAFVRAILLTVLMTATWPIAAHAQNSWLGTTGTTGNWSDRTKWSSGTVPDGSTVISIPNGTVLDDFNINTTNSFQLTVGAPGALNILSSITLNAQFAEIDNGGLFANSGVVNNGVFTNGGSGVLNNSGEMANFALENAAGGTVNNSGTLVEPQKEFVNERVFNNSGGMEAAGFYNVGSANRGLIFTALCST